jgi:hypothetical protein
MRRGDQEAVRGDRRRRAGALRLAPPGQPAADPEAGHRADHALGDTGDHPGVGVERLVVGRAGVGPLVAVGIGQQRVDELDGAHGRLPPEWFSIIVIL